MATALFSGGLLVDVNEVLNKRKHEENIAFIEDVRRSGDAFVIDITGDAESGLYAVTLNYSGRSRPAVAALAGFYTDLAAEAYKQELQVLFGIIPVAEYPSVVVEQEEWETKRRRIL